MKKSMLVALIGIMLSGTQLYAGNGDLIVDGNVGIGTDTPQRMLQLNDDSDGLSFEAATGSPNAGAIRFGDNSGWKMNFGRSRDSIQGALNSGNSGVLMTIQDDGKVGIGTLTPSQQLEVNGGVRLKTATTKPTCDANAAGTIWYVNGTTDDTLWVCAKKTSVYNWKQLW